MRSVLLLIYVFVAHFCVDFYMGVWPVYKSLAGIDLATAGIIFGLAGFFGDGLQLVTGVLGDRGYRRRGVLLGVLLAAGMAGGLLTTRPLFLLGCVGLMFLGSALFHPNAAALAGACSDKRKGLMMSIFASGGFLGLAVGPRLFALYYDQLCAHVWWLLIPTLIIAAGALFVRNQEPQPQTLGAFRAHGRPLRLLWSAQAALAAATYGWSFLLPDLLLAKGYSNALALGGAHFWMIFGCALITIPVGMVSDRIGQRKVILGAGVATICLWFLFLMSPQLSASLSVPLLFALGACLGVMNPMIVALGNRLMPQMAGSVSALLMGGAWCFGYLGIFLAGLLPGLSGGPINALYLMGALTLVPPLSALLLGGREPVTA